MLPYVVLSKIYRSLDFEDKLNLQRATNQIIDPNKPKFDEMYCPLCTVEYFQNTGDSLKDFGNGLFFLSKKGLLKTLTILPTFISGKSLFKSIEALRQHVLQDHLNSRFFNRMIKPGFLVNFDDQLLITLLSKFFDDLLAMEKYKTDWPEKFHNSEFQYAWALTPTMKTISTRALRPIFHFFDLILKNGFACKIPVKARFTFALTWHHYYSKEIITVGYTQVKFLSK